MSASAPSIDAALLSGETRSARSIENRAGPAVGRCLPPLHLLVRALSAFGGFRALAGVLAAGPVPATLLRRAGELC